MAEGKYEDIDATSHHVHDQDEEGLLGPSCSDDKEEEDNGNSGMTKEETMALGLKWTFGFNKKRSGGVHNLSDDARNAVFYFAAHTGVIYDYVNRKQTLLQGHCNPITCCAVSSDKRWIVTADTGKDSMIVVWDSITGAPIKTLFNPHPNGVESIDMSPDAMFLITLSAEINEQGDQEVAVWEWTVDHEGALYIASCPRANDDQEGKTTEDDENGSNPKTGVEQGKLRLKNIRFNTFDIQEFVTTGPQEVVFWSWKTKRLEHQLTPPLAKQDFGTKVGNFTQTVFLPHDSRAVSGTTEGNLVLWDAIATGGKQFEESKTNLRFSIPSRIASKVVKLNRSGSISFITTYDDMLVVGGEDESVRFYDLEFRIIAWFEDLDAGPIISVSFANSSNYHYVDTPVQGGGAGAGARSSTKQNGNAKYALADFVVATARALVIGVDAATFDDACAENRRGTLLLQGFDAPVACLAAHPFRNIFLAVSTSGIVQAWDYDDKRLIMVRGMHHDDHPTCAAFSPNGAFIAIGFENGMLRVLRWSEKQDMGELACFQVYPGVPITLLQFAPDSTFLGFADAENCVGLYRFVAKDVINPNGNLDEPVPVDSMRVDQGKRKNEPGQGFEPCDGSDSRNGWTYLGRYRSHNAPVTCLDFGKEEEEEDEEEGAKVRQISPGRFFSISEDGTLVEYDLDQSSVVDGIKLVGKPKRIEFGNSVPKCCLFQPATKDAREDLIITANTEYKIKCFNANNKTCRKTSLGPTYGGPLNRIAMINQNHNSKSGGLQYLAYATEEKVIGLVKLPFDGNPHKAMGLIAHPEAISGFVASHDGRFLLTAGGMTINAWQVNTSALDTSNAAACSASIQGIPKSLVPYLPLIDGGAHGDLYEEIVDYFYYAQLRCQGEETTSPRKTDGYVPLTEIPNLMRALGFYPTENQIEDMCSEIRYSDFAVTAKVVEYIGLEQFIKLYINHRPVMGLSQDHITKAFETILESCNMDQVDWRSLQQLLENKAEAMPSGELESCLTMLMGRSGASSLRPSSKISAQFFSEEMLGLGVVDDDDETDRHK